jgi:hypothetical protein
MLRIVDTMCTLAKKSDWKLVKTVQGINISTRKREETSVLYLKFEGIINAPFRLLWELLKEPKNIDTYWYGSTWVGELEMIVERPHYKQYPNTKDLRYNLWLAVSIGYLYWRFCRNIATVVDQYCDRISNTNLRKSC